MRLIKSLALKIGDLMKKLITDKEDRDYLIARLMYIKVQPASVKPSVTYPDDVRAILGKYKVKL